MTSDTALEIDNKADFTTALAYATTRVPQIHPDDTVADIRRQLGRGERFDAMTEVAVTEAGRLVGLIGIERVFTASPHTRAAAIMDAHPPVVSPGVAIETAREKSVSSGESSLAVVDAHGTFLGLIPAHQLLVSRT